jgi:hypothetical protein
VSPVIALAVLIVAFAAVVACVVIVAGQGRDDFNDSGGGSADALAAAFRAHGLTICESGEPDSGRGSGGAISTQQLRTAVPNACADDSIVVQLDRYAKVGDRDAAARSAELHSRPRAFGTVYTWHRYTVYLQADDASGQTATRDRVIDALDSVGAH